MQDTIGSKAVGFRTARRRRIDEKETPQAALVKLTPREIDVLRLLALGYKNQEIAQTLGIAYRTVAVHMGNVMQKLHVRNRTEALLYAARAGYVHEFAGAESGHVLCQECRRLEKFSTAIGGFQVENDVEATIQHLVDTTRHLLKSEFASLTIWDSEGDIQYWFGSGFPPEERSAVLESMSSAIPSDTPSVGFYVPIVPGSNLSPSELVHLPYTPISTFEFSRMQLKNQMSGALYIAKNEEDFEFSVDDRRMLDHVAVVAAALVEYLRLADADVTSRKISSALQENISEGLVFLDHNRCIVFCSSEAAVILDASPKDLLGRRIEPLLESAIRDTDSYDAVIEVIQSPAGARGAAVPMLIPSQDRTLKIDVFAIGTEGGSSMIGVALHDATAEQVSEQWREVVNSATSHEMRTLASVIVGFGELLQNQGLEEPLRRNWLDRIVRTSQGLTTLLDQMLVLSQLSLGKLPAKRHMISVGDVVQGTVAALKAMSADSHKFEVDIASDCPEVTVDGGQLNQILMILLNNAVQFSAQTGTISITVRPNTKNDEVIVTVTDDGMGIAPDDVEAIFMPFHRVPGSPDSGDHGSGLGLTIAREFVSQNAGKIWVESILGKGSTFHVSFPMRAVVLNEAPQDTRTGR